LKSFEYIYNRRLATGLKRALSADNTKVISVQYISKK